MTDTVALGYVYDTEVAYSFHAGVRDMLLLDATMHGRLMRGGYLACRYGTGGIVGARNKVAGQFLTDTDADWLFWLDTDMGFEPDTLERLLEVADPVERPIVGALCFAQKEIASDGKAGFRCAPRATILDWRPLDGKRQFVGRAHYPVNSLVRCSGTGAACVVIHRTVLEKIHDEHGPTWYDPIHTDDGPIGEDLSFCARAGALGFPVHVHTGVRTSHLKNTWVAEEDWWMASVPPPATEPVAVIVPVLTRPDNVEPLTRSLRASTGLARPYFVVDHDDTTELAAVIAAGADVITYTGDKPGTFAQKVNEAYRCTTEPWLFLCGDDVQFRPGWLDHAQQVAALYDGQVIGTNDLGNPRVMAGEHATHLLVRRSYVDELGASWDGPGIVAHEGYRHWFVDDEIVTAAKQRGVWQMALGSIVEHMHPAWGKGAMDDVYEIGRKHATRDRVLFEKRLRELA